MLDQVDIWLAWQLPSIKTLSVKPFDLQVNLEMLNENRSLIMRNYGSQFSSDEYFRIHLLTCRHYFDKMDIISKISNNLHLGND